MTRRAGSPARGQRGSTTTPVSGSAASASLRRSALRMAVNVPPETTRFIPASSQSRKAPSSDEGALRDWLEAGMKRVVSGGTLTAILRADRLNEALAALPLTGVVVLPLWPRAGEPARRVIVQARKGSRAPFRLIPGLILHDRTGAYTATADAILRGESPLALG